MPPVAKEGDEVTGTDTHTVNVPDSPPQNLPHPFNGTLRQDLSADVEITGKPAATLGSISKNDSPHVPTSLGVSFVSPPSNQGTVTSGSETVLINGEGAARNSDPVETCDDVNSMNSNGKVESAGWVVIGD